MPKSTAKSPAKKRSRAKYALVAGFLLVAVPFSMYSASIQTDATAGTSSVQKSETDGENATLSSSPEDDPAGVADHGVEPDGFAATGSSGTDLAGDGLAEDPAYLAYGELELSGEGSGETYDPGTGMGSGGTGGAMQTSPSSGTQTSAFEGQGSGSTGPASGPLPLTGFSPQPERVSP